MKPILIMALIFGSYWIWSNSKKNELEAQRQYQVTRDERDAARSLEENIANRVKAACRDALTTKLSSLRGDTRVLDWNPSDKHVSTHSETSTGYKISQTATVSGSKFIYNAECFTDKNFQLLDARFGWWDNFGLLNPLMDPVPLIN